MLTVTVVHLQSVFDCPPVISLIQGLLDIGCKVNLVSFDVNRLPKSILNHPDFRFATRDSFHLSDGLPGVKDRLKRIRLNKTFGRNSTKAFMETSDLLWTTTDITVRFLGKMVYDYKHIMQLMELIPHKDILVNYGLRKVPLSCFAEKAFRVVVPEINRAYIQQIFWELKKTPMVLPNKPYFLQEVSESQLDDTARKMLDKTKGESRKIVLYLGGICRDRNLRACAEAVKRMGADYCLYILGQATDSEMQAELEQLVRDYDCVEYLGFVRPPAHLLFVKHAYIGLLPYVITDKVRNVSVLNSLYCAPNKIYEYARYGLPMVGSDVLGLKQPFEQYRIGICAKEWTPDGILEACETVSAHHDEMAKNGAVFYDDTDFAGMLKDIIGEERSKR